MLQRLFISGCVTLLLVGCTTTETNPVTGTTPNVSAKVAQPPAKAVKPVLKPKAAVKPKTAPVKTVESAPENSDAALAKQWASCAGSVQALYAFGQDALKFNPSAMHDPSLKFQWASYEKFPLLRDSLYAYASAANASETDSEFKKVYTYRYTGYKTTLEGLLQKIAKGTDPQVASYQWLENYMQTVKVDVKKLDKCNLTIDQHHARFDAQVTPSLRYDKLVQLLWGRTDSNVAKKPSKKRSRKAS